jgi:peptide/nickel transport system ATP-binding protein
MALLQLNNLEVRYGRQAVLHDLTLHVATGETLGLLGESGSGKSTLGRAALRLQPTAAGAVIFDGDDITHLRRSALAPYRSRMQMVFQDPTAALNARQSIGTLLETPLAVHGLSAAVRRTVIADLLDRVALPHAILERFPHTLSGGQRQRVVIARALSLGPELVVCDEAVSALDVSIQAQILNLLAELKRERGLTYLFISHDLAVVRYIADRVAVIFRGRIVEIADRRQIWSRPTHPYTQSLLSENARVATASPPLGNPAVGCSYRTHCPLAVDRCGKELPPLRDLGSGHHVACHLAAAPAGSSLLQ